VREAQRLGLPVIALVDTNCDPDEATYVVPGNDDAIRSCSLVVRAIADGIAAGRTKVTEAELAAAPAAPQEPAVEPAAEASAAPAPTESEATEPAPVDEPTSPQVAPEPAESAEATGEPVGAENRRQA
jgi:small subunit ribosomal protein S2